MTAQQTKDGTEKPKSQASLRCPTSVVTPPPEEVDMVTLQTRYIEQLKAETNRMREEEARAKRPNTDTRIVCEVSLKQQVQEYLLSQPPIMRDKPLSLMSLRAQIQGRYNARPSAGDLGIALTSLGFTRKRDYSNNGNGRRFWMPPSRG